MLPYYLLPNKLCETSLLPASNLSSAVFHVPWPLLPQGLSSRCNPPTAVLKPAAISSFSFQSCNCSGHSPDSPDHNRQQRNCLHCLFLPTVEHHFCMRGQWWSHWVRSCCSWRCKVSFSCSHGRGLPHLLRASGHSGPVCKLHTHLCIEQKWTTKPEYLHLHLQEICFLHVSSTVVSPTSLSLGIMMY